VDFLEVFETTKGGEGKREHDVMISVVVCRMKKNVENVMKIA
jgi:hypothetical protein